jgi:hypothetical protein
MDKTKALKLLNPVMGCVLVVQAVSGFAGDAMPEELFEAVHVTGAILLLLCVAGHVALNWSWIKAHFLRKSSAAA